MTRQEIYNNIRYNENLVNQYLNTINRLNSTISDLNSQISNCEYQISQLNSEIRNRQSQISELNQLRNKYQKLQTDFADRQSVRINSFNSNFSRNVNVNFMSSYVIGMRSLLSGNEYRNAYNGISAAIHTISNKIYAIESEIDNLNRSIISSQATINNCRRDIGIYQNQIAGESSKLSYRRQRIVYWKNQLRYAR